ncbi:magnesium transporter NIPA-domain-containing protein [Catenaria anguillulae PL171]|uniref:Magnesium transporter NIPA-domain-containing protein n=1 Tax=Catenaria anguillulae PL171 TaxID=765915 RepID=A0A1Y2I4R5_9FUNG|nr:magnesium transporter NIPA-domain-containing protein [Catenaria anguillulae PL171]
MPPAVIQPATAVGAFEPPPTIALALGSASSSTIGGNNNNNNNNNAATQLPPYFPVLGIGLAVFSSLLIGLSYVLQKKGMTRAQASKRRKRAAAAQANAGAATGHGRLPPEPTSPTALLDTRSTLDGEARDSDVVIRIEHVEADDQENGDRQSADSPPPPHHDVTGGFGVGGMSTSVVRPAAEANNTRSRRASCTEKHAAGQAAAAACSGTGAGGDSDPNVDELAKARAPNRVEKAPKRRRRGPPYLYSRQWWFGTFLNLVGEAANLGAYAFTSAIVVAPLGALSVVVSAILSSFMLAERMNLQGKLGCALSLMGSTILVLNAPAQVATADMDAFSRAYFAPVFVVWNVIAVLGSLALVFYVVPRYRSNALGYLGACSLLGSLSVIEIQAVATAVVGSLATSAGSSPTKSWLWWVVLVKAIVELVSQLYFLNEALARFSAVLVTPLYYAGFTSATLLANFLLNPPWSTLDARTGFTCFLAFAIICSGVLLLQTSKITTTTTTEVAAMPESVAAPGVLASSRAHGLNHSDPTMGISRQRSVMSFSHDRFPSTSRHSPSLLVSTLPALAPGASSSTLLPVPSHQNLDTFTPPFPVTSPSQLTSAAFAAHGRERTTTSVMLSPIAPASAPVLPSGNVLHVHTREQPLLYTMGHFPELLSALMRALHSTMDEHDAHGRGAGADTRSAGSNSSLTDSPSSSVKIDPDSSPLHNTPTPRCGDNAPARVGTRSPGTTSAAIRRPRAMSWPGPGAIVANLNAFGRAASPTPAAAEQQIQPLYDQDDRHRPAAQQSGNPSESRRRAAALRGRLQSAMQLVQWLSSHVAAAGSSAAGSMAAGMNTATGLVRHQHHPSAPASLPLHAPLQQNHDPVAAPAAGSFSLAAVHMRPSLSASKVAEALALPEVKGG